jgi:hypothetical protein
MTTEKKCYHGMTFNVECVQCEIIALKETLSWMKRAVAKDEKRLAELQRRSMISNGLS